MNLSTWLEEVRRRRVIRAMVGWGLFSFAALQVVEPVQHALGLADWALKVVVAVLALGFPITAGLAWAFDLTWRGVERTAPAEGTGKWAGTRPGVALVVLGALLGAAVAGFAGWHLWGRSPEPGPDGRVLVAVADVVNETGEKELDVLSGLLVTSLEQSRRLSVMTQARVLDLAIRAGRKGAAKVDETIGREVGKANGVRALLLPAIRRLGNTYSLEMRAIDPVSDRHLFTVSDRSLSKEALLDLLDRLSESTRTELGEGAKELGTSRVQLGEAMTRSVEAYQHYAAGLEAWLRDGLRDIGLKEFQEALRIDPSFAAAHAELANLYDAYGQPEQAATHRRTANAQLDSMPKKEQLLLRMKRAHADPSLEHWSRDEALRFAEEAVRRFPGDKFVLAWASDAYEAFDLQDRRLALIRQAHELDPGFFYATILLTDALAGRVADALAVARRAVATRRSPANLAVLSAALHAGGDDLAAAAAAREALAAGGASHSLVALNACEALYDLGAADECMPVWSRMTTGGSNDLERDFARFQFQNGLAYQGRIREALRLAATAADPARAAPPEWLATIHQVGRPRLECPQAIEAARRIPNPQFRRNYLSWLGATAEAERITSSLEGKGYEIVEKVNTAMDLAARGRPAEAAEVIRSVREEAHRRNASGSQYGLAAFHAEVLLAAGRAAEAAETWPAPLPCRCTYRLDRAAQYPRLALLRARAMEQLGRRPDAIRELDGVLAFWKNADNDLPLLIEAKAMKARLRAAPVSPGGRP